MSVVGEDLTAITSYARYYKETDWKARGVSYDRVFNEFKVDVEGTGKNSDELYAQIKATRDEMPHAYVMMIKDTRRLMLLHRTMHFVTAMGGSLEPWQEKVLMFSGDVMASQLPQPAVLPPRIFNLVEGTMSAGTYIACRVRRSS